MGLIPEEIIAQVLDRCDIVETISGYIPLKRAGRNFKACCPFHHEKTPSFVVNPGKQIFHCFGCGVGGNVVSFLMQQERIDFPEALRMLASKVGVEIPAGNSFDQETLNLKELLFKANDLAVEFFHNTLVTSNEVGHVIKYLRDRGLSLDAVKKFKIGFAQEKWDSLLGHLRSKNISLNLMEKAGLIVPRENREGYYDRFRDRIIFPIFDIKSRCIGFGARAMKEGIAKYINSPETAVYTKGNHLYGFHATKDAVREKDFVIIVEGYMDFVVPFQAGVGNIVASLGTALTVEQVRLLKRYTQNVVMLFDADSAGENAMVRSLDLLIEEGIHVKVATLATGEDPDSFVRKYGVEEFQKRVEEALSLFDYKIKILMGKYSHKTPEGKAKISGEMLLTINRFNNAIIKFDYLKRLASLLAIPEEALLVEMQKLGSPLASTKIEALPKSDVAPIIKSAERNLLKLMIEDEAFIPLVKEEVALTDLCDEQVRKIISQMVELSREGKAVTATTLMNCFHDEQILKMISQLAASEDNIAGDKEKVYRDCIQRIKSDRLKSERQDLSQQIKLAEASGDENRLNELTQRFNHLIKG